MSISLPIVLTKLNLFDEKLFNFSLTKEISFSGEEGEISEDASTVSSFIARPHTWVISANSKPIGLLNIEIPVQTMQPYYCNAFIYIFTTQRRNGYAKFVTKILAQAFRRNPNYKLYTIIDEGDEASVAGLKKAFPDIQAENKVNEKTQEVYVEDQLFFDLSTGGTDVLTRMERPIYNTLSAWVLDELN